MAISVGEYIEGKRRVTHYSVKGLEKFSFLEGLGANCKNGIFTICFVLAAGTTGINTKISSERCSGAEALVEKNLDK